MLVPVVTNQRGIRVVSMGGCEICDFSILIFTSANDLNFCTLLYKNSVYLMVAFNPFNHKLIMEILPTIQEEND